ncbi:MAG: DUF2220 family protein [Leptospiraceae bacterium]|nr:DUF2220 family protein [Leptospiraceae bacterium]
MKSYHEIQNFCLNKYKEFLICNFSNIDFFPLRMNQFGKYKSNELSKNFFQVDSEILELKKNSKEELGYGYEIEWETSNARNSGKNNLPSTIYFSNKSDYLKFIDKENEFFILEEDANLMLEKFPELNTWFLENPSKLISISDDLEKILSIFEFFKKNPRPNLYLRELPIEGIDTKFIERNKSILIEILDIILDSDNILLSEDSIEKRYYLKTKPILIRFRILSDNYSLFPKGVRDISIPISEFKTLVFSEKNVFITENLINFLSFPNQEDSIIICGGGYSVLNLNQLENLQDKEIYYWGDIDMNGFDILSKFREFFPTTKSFLMDTITYQYYSHLAVSTNISIKSIPNNLTRDEFELFDFLSKKQTGNRLEQEKIPFDCVKEKLIHLHTIGYGKSF